MSREADTSDNLTRAPHASGAGSPKTGALPPAWDVASALERVEGDRELLDELAHMFADECPKAMQEIGNALKASDAVLLERHAHTMKGSAANIGANGAAAAALVLEQEARSGDLANAHEHFHDLEVEIARLLPELEALSAKRVP